MFSVDASEGLVRVVVSDSDSTKVDHAVLLASRVPLGTDVTSTHHDDLWDVEVRPQDQSVAHSTHDGHQVLTLRLEGVGPCRLRFDVAGDVQAWGSASASSPPTPGPTGWGSAGRSTSAAS